MPRKTFQNKITTAELYEKINPQNLKLMDSFLRAKNISASDSTIRNYRSDLTIFFTWILLYADNKFFVDLKKSNFIDFFAYCVVGLKWGGNRFNRMRSALSSMSTHIERVMDDEYPLFKNIVIKSVETSKSENVRNKTVFSEEQIDVLLKNLWDRKKYQEVCWFALAIASGARFSELLRFTTDIIDLDHTVFNDLFIACKKPIKTKGRTKTGKMLTKYIIKKLFAPYYMAWIPERRKVMDKGHQSHSSLFVKPDGTPAQEGTVRSWIKDYETIVGVPFYPHALRHYAATYLSKQGMPHDFIKEIFGWESGDMVDIYDDTTFADKNWSELDKLESGLNKTRSITEEEIPPVS
jgi:site-specific recombinase XerD